MTELYLYRTPSGDKAGGKDLSLGYIRRSLMEAYPSEAIDVYKDEKGKPHADIEGVYVSATHSGDIIICAVSDSPVGIDLQHPRKLFNRDRIAARYFSQNEAALIDKEGDSAFFEIWCRKEAWVKLKGTGLAGGIREVDTVDEEGVLLKEIDGIRIEAKMISGAFFACAGGSGELNLNEMGV